MSETRRVSPLAAILKPGTHGHLVHGPAVHLSTRLCRSLVQVQSWPDTNAKVQNLLAAHIGTPLSKDHQAVVTKGGSHIIPTGPGRYWIESDQPGLDTTLRGQITSDMGAVTGLTHSRVVVTVKGEKAAWLLATGIGIDFAEHAFPAGSVRLTHHHEIGLTINRVDAQTFELYAFTSYARGLWHWLTEAASEVGYEVAAAS
ncbi:MAG: hypothetical protein AAGI12_07620 [Pseudomonadota bacterium]